LWANITFEDGEPLPRVDDDGLELVDGVYVGWWVDSTTPVSDKARTVCDLWLIDSNGQLFEGTKPLLIFLNTPGHTSEHVRIWDLATSDNALGALTSYRVADLTELFEQLFGVEKKRVVVGTITQCSIQYLDELLLSLDNKTLEKESGAEGGSTECRCPLCFAPAPLYNLVPFLGHPRTWTAAVEHFQKHEVTFSYAEII